MACRVPACVLNQAKGPRKGGGMGGWAGRVEERRGEENTGAGRRVVAGLFVGKGRGQRETQRIGGVGRWHCRLCLQAARIRCSDHGAVAILCAPRARGRWWCVVGSPADLSLALSRVRALPYSHFLSDRLFALALIGRRSGASLNFFRAYSEWGRNI